MTMSISHVNGFKAQHNPAYVIKHNLPDDVARAMIENGQQKQPFYIFNMNEAYRRIQHFKISMPRFKLFYALKSNNTDMMVRLAVALGLGFDCASPGEIYELRRYNVNPKSIIYNMPCKTSVEMEYARKAGVTHTTFDDCFELKKIKEFWPDARLILRIRVDEKANDKEKFGCGFKTEAIDLLNTAADLKLNVVGVAFQVPYCSPENYVLGMQQARTLFDYEEQAGRSMTILDIGGGFLSDRTDRIDEASRLINATLLELFPDQRVQVISKPGRYISDSAFKLFCSIIGVRQIIKDGNPVNMIYLNNGKYGTMRFDQNWHKFERFQRSTDDECIKLDNDEDTIVWGPSCDSMDRLMKDIKVRLPRCYAGDWLVMDNHGAYTFSFSTKFSSLDIPLIRSVITEDLWKYIKMSSVFEPSDFVLDPDISTSLPSTLPSVMPRQEDHEVTDIYTLKV